MGSLLRGKSFFVFCLAVFLLVGSSASADAAKLSAKYNSAYGWVKPGDTYPFFVAWEAGPSGATSATISVSMPSSAVFVSSVPPPSSGIGSAGSPLTYNLGLLAPNASGRIVIRARALGLDEDPEIMWKNLSATARLSATVGGVPQPEVSAKTLGPKVTTLRTARYGERPFPVVMVQYQDIRRCTGPGQPYEECTGDHNAAALDEAVNSRTSGRSLWQLYNDMSFGQLSPVGFIRPQVGSTAKPFDPTYNHKFSSLSPNGTCSGVTLAGTHGTPLYANRIENGWYVLPGTQGYYGADRTGHALAGALTGQGLLFGVDDACGPTGKIVYDAASLADPDLDYNDFDTDKDGVVDFFNLMFAGDGGNGHTTLTGINNVWPHKSDVRYYFTDANGETGYVSNDQLRNHEGQPMYWTDSSRKTMTTANTGIKVFVRVGPYNVNPESAVERMSVIAHEYGHSLGLPDFYSTGSRSTFGTWELMASDHAQYMTVFARQDMGWIVPVEAEDGVYTLRESKIDTGTITWKRPDGTPYTLTGDGIHNADALRVQLPKVKLIDEVPSGTRAWHSGAGDDFGCPGHTLDVFLPDLTQHANASAVTLRFKSLYEIEWDWDYGFVLVSADGGATWQSLASKKGTTISGYNPNAAACYLEYDNGITGVSGQPNNVANLDRALGEYPAAQWIDDEFDLTPFKGQSIILRFAYFTDAYVAKRGWFIDDMSITADAAQIYTSDFEEDEHTRLFPGGWSRVSSADGVDVDHAYYVELRDRVSWDKDGKGQSERGEPTWAPGLAIIYTDENHGYGNTGAADQPAQTIVDSQPQPGNMTPNVDDAAYTLTAGDDQFDGCTHIDNYRTATSSTWKLPAGVAFTLTSLSGLSTGDAVATVIANVGPDCSIIMEPPVLSLAPGQPDPDTDGSIDLAWTRPHGASGPDEVQEATMLLTLAEDDAENGLGQWIATTSGVGAMSWESSQAKTSSGSYAFWGSAAEGALDAAAILTYARPIDIPAAGTATLAFSDWYMHEGDDKVVAEVSDDGGATWTAIYEGSRSALAPDAATAFATESMTARSVSLEAYKGLAIHLRFRFVAGPENRAGSTPLGWYIDDVRIESANWTDVGSTGTPSFTRGGLTTGMYHYRVRTAFPAGPVTVPSPWSNVVTARVEYDPPAQHPDLFVSSIRARNNKGNASERVTVTAVIANSGNATAAASTTKFVMNGQTVLAVIDTPAIAPGGSVEVTLQWDTRALKGDHTISVTADDAQQVIESNETNNTSTASYSLKGGKV